MSPDGYRNEGTPSLSEGPDARGETFWFLLGRLPKGTRCKSETISGRHRRNGYVHQGREWSATRPPSRASPLPHLEYAHPRKTGQLLTMKPARTPLPQRHSRLPSTEKEKLSQSPQVEGPNYRHSKNRTKTPDNSKSANPTGKIPVNKCPFDCQHGIANTHGNLMLPARNKE